MSYSMYNGGLGYDIELDTPVGVQTVSFDLQKVSNDLTSQLIADAWPKVMVEAEKSMPVLVDQAYAAAAPHLYAERDQALVLIDERVASVKKVGLFAVGAIAVAVIGSAIYLKSPKSRRATKSTKGWA